MKTAASRMRIRAQVKAMPAGHSFTEDAAPHIASLRTFSVNLLCGPEC